jgi:hypothetical protein
MLVRAILYFGLLLTFNATSLKGQDSTYINPAQKYYINEFVSPLSLFKSDLLFFFDKEWQFYYEQTLSPHLSIEGGFGFIMDHINEMPAVFSGSQEAPGSPSGGNLQLELRYYLAGTAPWKGYLGYQYRYRFYRDDIQYSYLSVLYGYQLRIWNNFILGGDIGIGYRFTGAVTGALPEFSTPIVLPLSLKLGFFL